MNKPKGDLHLVEYRNPANDRRHRIWLFRKQSPAPNTSAVHCKLKTFSEEHTIVVSFEDKKGEGHFHRYPMVNVARSEAGPADVEK